MSDRPNRIAVTVIGGYLGAGKTTLLNNLLRDADERIAVLVNDFGDVNIDLDLIEKRTDDTIELSNGCICCSMVDGFSEALDRIVAMEPRAERLVIETSGVADPATVAAYGHGPGLSLDAVVVLVDVETVRTTANDRYLAQTIRSQLQAAEILVVNKVDLVDDAVVQETSDWLREQCPEAFLLTTSNSVVAPEVLFGRPSTRTFVPDGHHHPERLFATRTVEPAAPVTREWVTDLMDRLHENVVRAKGLVQLQDVETPWLVQRVGARWSFRPSPVGWPSEPATRIVIIERAL
ncbi:MAG: GTP-binding protein [Actinomycetota bacterium]